MGGWDCNCAICAGPLQVFDPFNGDAYDPEVISMEDLEWLETLRIIGYNPDSFTVNKCYITGPGTMGDYGSVEVDRGDDFNVPGSPRNSSRITLNVYSNYDPDEPLSIPFHEPCFRVFAQALRYHLSGGIKGFADPAFIDKDVLYAAMSKLHKDYDHCLELDHGELNEIKSYQYWVYEPGHEAWVSNPFASQQMSAFFETLERGQLMTDEVQTSGPMESSKRSLRKSENPFTRLAKEITCEILLHLPYQDVQNFILSGASNLKLSQIQSFWKRKILIDMPWLWELPNLEGRQDWRKLYHELRRQSIASTHPIVSQESTYAGAASVASPRDPTLVLGLANRRRVWNACSQLAQLYMEERREKGLDSKPQEVEISQDIVRNSVSLAMPLVASPVSKDFRSISSYFLSSWNDLETGITLKFHFRDDGRLCGIESSCLGRASDARLFGTRPEPGESVNINIPSGTWLAGWELNICNTNDIRSEAKTGITGIKVYFQNADEIQLKENDGAKRLMMSSNDMIVTGTIGELGDGVIQRLGLLQCPREPSLLPPRMTPPSMLEKCLWKNAIPPRALHPSSYVTGYWMPERSFDTISMEALVFGLNETELQLIAGFSCDAQYRSFGIHYQDGNSKLIGPADTLSETKIFEIDGKSGERITKVEIGMNSLPHALKITTNRARFAFFGQNQKNYHMVYEEDDNCFIAGIYASWGYSSKDRLCTTISVLSGARQEQDHTGIAGVHDNTVWSPSRPKNRGIVAQRDYIAVADAEDVKKFKGLYW